MTVRGGLWLMMMNFELWVIKMILNLEIKFFKKLKNSRKVNFTFKKNLNFEKKFKSLNLQSLKI
jgi:hypothetical protein